jgi:hypothetical protein
MRLRAITFRFNSDFHIPFLLIVSLYFIAIASKPLLAQNEDEILDFQHAYPQRAEYIYLPNYCVLKMEIMKLTNDGRKLPPNIAREQEAWTKRLGETSWTYIHHYCAGLIRINRFERSIAIGIGGVANMTDLQKSTLVYALHEFESVESPYIKSHSPLYAEAIISHAKALSLLGRKQAAVDKMSEGISSEPERDILYLCLAQILFEMGDQRQAKKVLELGERRTKGSKRIQEMLSHMDRSTK